MSIKERPYAPRTPVTIVVVGDTGEALLLRSILESLNAAVTIHFAATPGQFLRHLNSSGNPPDFLIISAHGNEGGFSFGPYGPSVDTTALVDGALPAESLMGNIDLAGSVVCSTACLTGTDAFGRAFLEGGARAYIAPQGFPEGAAVPLALHGLFYDLFQRELDLDQALLRLHPFDPEEELSLAVYNQSQRLVPQHPRHP